MTNQLIIPTELPSLHLRELNKPADDQPFFEMVQQNQEFWTPYASDVLLDNRYITWVQENRRQAKSEGELRLGIFNEENMVGWASLMDHSSFPDVGSWCGIWLDRLNTGKGFATLSLRSLVQHVRSTNKENQWVATSIDQSNSRSRALFERVGFVPSPTNPLPLQHPNHIAYRMSPEIPIR